MKVHFLNNDNYCYQCCSYFVAKDSQLCRPGANLLIVMIMVNSKLCPTKLYRCPMILSIVTNAIMKYIFGYQKIDYSNRTVII